jgi:ubiquinone/menaquinone biosynthesis C-methylase UbiE
MPKEVLDNKQGIKSTGNSTLQFFYDKAAIAPSGFNFLSPSGIESWRNETVEWINKGKEVCEIGPGFGEIALNLISKCTTPKIYFMVDISQAMLNVVEEKLSRKNNPLVKIKYIKADIQGKVPKDLCSIKFDRVLAVNVLQDVNVNIALKNIKKILQPGGLFFVLFWKENPYYDSSKGYWYSNSFYHEKNNCDPLGYRTVGSQKKPYYRLLNCFTRKDIHSLLRSSGFKIQTIEPIIYPIDFIMKRWNSKFHYKRLNEKQIELLKEWNGYLDGWSVKAKFIKSKLP